MATITGHVYKDIWTPVIGEVLNCAREPQNRYDKNAVTIMRYGTIVGRVPRELANQISSAILTGRKVTATITGKRQNTRGNGLEVPAKYIIE